MDYVMKKSTKDFGFITHKRQCERLPEIKLNDLDYADDIALLEGCIKRAQEQLNETSNNGKDVGLEINVKKTKIMRLNEDPSQSNIPLTLNGEAIESVENFKYLGSQMQSTEKDFEVRKGQAWGAYRQLSNIWKSKTTPVHLKINIFKASCLSILLYGSETWVLTQKLRNELDSFATNCYRYILGVKRLDKVSNNEIYERVKQIPLSVTLGERQLTWIGHMLRRNENELIRKYALYGPDQLGGDAKIGKPKLTYIKEIQRQLNPGLKENEIKLEAKEIVKMAQDREKWKKRVIDCTGAKGFSEAFCPSGATER
jgi:hypothetical protein